MIDAQVQMWTPPEREEVDKVTQYQAAAEQNNELEITSLVAERRDTVMRKQLDVSAKFMDRINDQVDALDEIDSQVDQRKVLRSLAETMKVVSDVEARAAMFDHVAKPKPQETQTNRISLFVNCAPVGIAEKPAIDVEVVQS